MEELKIWSSVLNTDGVTNVDQRRELTTNEYIDGWLRGASPTAPQVNELFYLITGLAGVHYSQVTLIASNVTTPSIAIDCDGGAIDAGEMPLLSLVYGANTPDLTSWAPPGFKAVLRRQ